MQAISFTFGRKPPIKPEVPSAERLELERKLDPWRNSDSHGKQRIKRAESPFTIKYNSFHLSLHYRHRTIFSDVLESGTQLGHLVSPKKYPFLQRVMAVILVSRIGFWGNASNALTRR